MKLIHLIAAVSLGLSGLAFAAAGHDHGHEHKALHGGIVTEVKDVDYELLVKPDAILLFVRDHGKPVNISQASAKATLLSGTEKREIDFKPAGDMLEAKGNFNAIQGAKVLVAITLPGKPAATARFVLK